MLPKPEPDVSLGARLATAAIVAAYCLVIGLVLVIATLVVMLTMVGYDWGQNVPAPIWVLLYLLVFGGPAAGAWLALKASRTSAWAARDGQVFLAPVVAACTLSITFIVYVVLIREQRTMIFPLLALPFVTGFIATFVPHAAAVRDWHVAIVAALGALALIAGSSSR